VGCHDAPSVQESDQEGHCVAPLGGG
jgi:hypothetical protein